MADKVAGVISFNGSMPRHNRPLLRLPEVRALRVFVAHGIATRQRPLYFLGLREVFLIRDGQ